MVYLKAFTAHAQMCSEKLGRSEFIGRQRELQSAAPQEVGVCRGRKSWTGATFFLSSPVANKVPPLLCAPYVFDPNSEGTVSQVINVTNAMQGTKTLMMKLKIQFQRGGVSVTEMAQVAQFPAGY